MKCLDTTFLIDLLKNEPKAIEKAKQLEGEILATTSVNVFEVLFGLYSNLSEKKIRLFKEFINELEIINLDKNASDESAKIRVTLKNEGNEVGIADSLIAGTMLVNNCNIIVTRNKDHFERIEGIKVENY